MRGTWRSMWNDNIFTSFLLKNCLPLPSWLRSVLAGSGFTWTPGGGAPRGEGGVTLLEGEESLDIATASQDHFVCNSKHRNYICCVTHKTKEMCVAWYTNVWRFNWGQRTLLALVIFWLLLDTNTNKVQMMLRPNIKTLARAFHTAIRAHGVN